MPTVSADRHHSVHREYRAPIERVMVRIVNWVFGVIITFIALRFVLLLFGANPAAGFVQFIYGVSDVFMVPFVAIFNTTRVEGATFEWSALIAIAVYALLGWALVSLIRAASPREYVEDVDAVETHDTDVTPTTRL